MKIPDWAITHKAVEVAIDRGAYWDQQAADKIIRFAEKIFRCKQIEGPFIPLEWQAKWLQTLYGFRDKDGNRQYRYALLHVPKKCGKTMLSALLCCYELLYPSEIAPEIYSGSVGAENAKQIYTQIINTLEHHKILDSRKRKNKNGKVIDNQKYIELFSTKGTYKGLASDGNRFRGYHSSLTVLDEAAYHKNSSLWDSLKYAHSARKKSGLCIIISTAGDNFSGYYYHLYQKAKRLLSGEDLDTTWFPTVYEMSSPDADPESREEWYRAVPSLGISYSEEAFKNDLDSAKKDPNPVEFLRWKRDRVNCWCNADSLVFFDVVEWDKNKTAEPDLTTAIEVRLGFDLSLNTDPSAITALFIFADGTVYLKSWSWVARKGVEAREKTSLPKYIDFQKQGCLTITDGDMIDRDAILAFAIDLTQKYKVTKAVFDPTSAVVMMNDFERATGVDTRWMPTSFRFMSVPMKHFQASITAGNIKHDGNNFFRYALQCVRVETTRDGDIRPATKKSSDHIDAVVAALCAYSDWVDPNAGTEQQAELIII